MLVLYHHDRAPAPHPENLPTAPFAGKGQWRAQQRRLPPREKIRILIEWQRREAESNGINPLGIGRGIAA